MHLRRFDLYRYRLPFSQPLTLHYREGLLLRLTGDDGSEGWGESAPLHGVSGESLEEAAARLRELVGEIGVPVALDESLLGMEPQELEEQRYARAVVLKPMLVGGILRTLRLAQSALSLGMMPVVSSAYESGVGTAALVALAAGSTFESWRRSSFSGGSVRAWGRWDILSGM